mgnify:CR=1 FL=1
MDEKAKILMVAADAELSRVLGQTLEVEGGYRVEYASTGEEAQAKAGEHFYNVVVLDLDTTESEGIYLLSIIRKVHSVTQGILLCDSLGTEAFTGAIEGGYSGVVVKPVNSEDLIQTTQKALEKQQLDLQVQDRQRKELISAISHELRNPITSILFSVDLLSEELSSDSTPSVLKLIENIFRSAQRMDSWIQTLSDLSKLRLEDILNLHRADPVPVLQRAVDSVTPHIKEREQSVVLKVADPLPRVQMDEHRVEQVIAGLLAVASRFSPRGSELILNARKEVEALKVDICDSAPPIRGDILRQLSCPYYRAESDKQYLARLGLEEHVILPGWRRDIPEILSAAHIFVCASHAETGAGAVQEAMAMAKPVVSTRVWGPVDYLVEGRGILVDVGDAEAMAEAIIWLAENPERGREMGEAARRFAEENFTYTAFARTLLRKYERVGLLSRGTAQAWEAPGEDVFLDVA